MEVTSESQRLNLRKVFRRVLKSQRGSFTALSFLFLFPSSVTTVLFPAITKFLSPDFPVTVSEIPADIILLWAAFSLFSLFITPCAIGWIICTVFNGFNGDPVNLKSAVKSIGASFFPLLATILAVKLIIIALAFSFALLVIITTTTSAFLGLEFLSLPYVLGFATAMFVVLMVYLQVNWSLSLAVVVAESSWGFAPLKRSKELIKGKRGLALCVNLIFGILNVFFLWNNWYTADYVAALHGDHRPSTTSEWRNFFLHLTLRFLFTSVVLTVTNWYNLIVNAVLYIYCANLSRANLAAINVAGGEFARRYFSLPVDDEKVALHV